MDLGQRLKQARITSGMTQEALARHLGVSRQTVSNWENSRSAPDVGSVIELGKLYDVSLDKLLSGEEVIRQFEDLAERRRRFCQQMLEIGIIVQLLGSLLRGLDFPGISNFLTWSGFLLLNVTIIMHLRVFDHDRGEIFRGLAGITGRWMLLLWVFLFPEITDLTNLTVSVLNLVCLILVWSAGVWTFDLKSTRLWLIVVLIFGAPLLLAGLEVQDSGMMVTNNPFLKNYRVETILYPQGDATGKHAVVELGSDSMMLATDGVNRKYIGRFTYAAPTVEDTAKGIWLLSPGETSEEFYKLTLEQDDSLLLSYTNQSQLQWQWKLKPDHRRASLTISTYGHDSYRNITWYPDELSVPDPTPSFGSVDVVVDARFTITIAGAQGKPLTLQEEYHHGEEIDCETYTLLPDEKGYYVWETKARYGGLKQQYAIYRIDFEEGEYRFLLTLQGF